MRPMITPMTPAVTRSGHALCSNKATTLAAHQAVAGDHTQFGAKGLRRAKLAQEVKALAQFHLAIDHRVGDAVGLAEAPQIHITRRKPHDLGDLGDAFLALPQVGEGNDDRGGAGPHLGRQAQPLRRPADGCLQARRRGAVLVQPPRQLGEEGDAGVDRGGGETHRHGQRRGISQYPPPSRAGSCRRCRSPPPSRRGAGPGR